MVLLIAVFSTLLMPAQAYNRDIMITDRYGNKTGSITKVGNKQYVETDIYGNVRRTYYKNGKSTYIFNKNGNLVGSFDK